MEYSKVEFMVGACLRLDALIGAFCCLDSASHRYCPQICALPFPARRTQSGSFMLRHALWSTSPSR